MSRTKTLFKAPFSVVLGREWGGCPAIWVGMSQDQSGTTAPLNGGGGTERGVRDICVSSACAHARHTDDTHAFPQTTLFVVSKPNARCVIGASFACHREKRTSHLGPPHVKVPDQRIGRTLCKKTLGCFPFPKSTVRSGKVALRN